MNSSSIDFIKQSVLILLPGRLLWQPHIKCDIHFPSDLIALEPALNRKHKIE